jgi:hypothetical protein
VGGREVETARIAGSDGLRNYREITDIETIAVGHEIRDLARLGRVYGPGHWRKLKGIATIRLASGRVRLAELHWYQAHVVGRKEIKRKRYVER